MSPYVYCIHCFKGHNSYCFTQRYKHNHYYLYLAVHCNEKPSHSIWGRTTIWQLESDENWNGKHRRGKKKWTDNIVEQTGNSFAETHATAHNRQEWRESWWRRLRWFPKSDESTNHKQFSAYVWRSPCVLKKKKKKNVYLTTCFFGPETYN